nr:uncharacterized protein LOC112288736 isoform X2 [Physcomitrium patens]|eukprot:XP_024389028.1 uncharacterized protein LOC112288736 isoform X2 [Physcomitrella patens]
MVNSESVLTRASAMAHVLPKSIAIGYGVLLRVHFTCLHPLYMLWPAAFMFLSKSQPEIAWPLMTRWYACYLTDVLHE